MERPRTRTIDETRPARVLVADDDRTARETACNALRGAGFWVDIAADGQSAVDRVARGNIDVAVLDVVTPRLLGTDACKLIKALGTSPVPVLLLSSRADVASRIEGLRAGADDFLGKPFDETELCLRVAALARTKRLLDQANKRRIDLEQASLLDEVTGLPNQRFLSMRLSEEWKRAERYREPLAYALIEVDKNRSTPEVPLDSAVIRAVATAVRRGLRDADFVARTRGQELVALLPSTHFAGAATACDRLARRVREVAFDESGRAIRPTVSVGVALFPSKEVQSRESLVRCAEGALARARAEGGGRIYLVQHQGYVFTPSHLTTPAPETFSNEGDRESAPVPLSNRFGAAGPVSSRFDSSAPPPSSRFDAAPASSRMDAGPSSSRFDSSGPASNRFGATGDRRRPSGS